MVKSFFIFAAVRRQAGEDRTGGAVRPATACAACGVHAAGHWNGFASAIFRPRRFAALVSGADPAVGSCGLRFFLKIHFQFPNYEFFFTSLTAFNEFGILSVVITMCSPCFVRFVQRMRKSFVQIAQGRGDQYYPPATSVNL